MLCRLIFKTGKRKPFLTFNPPTTLKMGHLLASLCIKRSQPPRIISGLRLVSWCFEPSQPQRITSGLRETFIKRYIVQRTNKAELRTEKAKSCRENLWNEIELKGQ